MDVLSGGTGADLFVYRTTKEGGDKITDFKSGTDKFEFSASEFGNLTTTNFDGVSGSTPDITGKELVIFTGGSYASLEAAQAKAVGNSTTAGFFAFTNASNETVLYFDSNGTVKVVLPRLLIWVLLLPIWNGGLCIYRYDRFSWYFYQLR